jgi:hypothetical protein
MPDDTPNGSRALRSIVWPGLILLSMIMISSIGLVAVAFLASPQAVGDVAQAVSRSNSIARLAALIIILPSIVTMAILDKIEGAAAMTAIGAIAGYVLGTTTASVGAP